MQSHFDVNNSANNFEVNNFNIQEIATTNVNPEEAFPTENKSESRKEQARKIDKFIKENYDITAHNFDQVRPDKEIKPHKAVFILLGDRHGDDTISRTNAKTVELFQHLLLKKTNQSSLSKVFTEGGRLEGHKASQAHYIDKKVAVENWDTYKDIELATAAGLRKEVLDLAEQYMHTNMDFIENIKPETSIRELSSQIMATDKKINLCNEADNNFFIALEKSDHERNTTLGKTITQSGELDQKKVIVIAGSHHLTLNDKNNPIRNLLIKTGQPYIALNPKTTEQNIQNNNNNTGISNEKLKQTEVQSTIELESPSKQEQLVILEKTIQTGIEKIKSMPTEFVHQIDAKMKEVKNVLNDQSSYLSIKRDIANDALNQEKDELQQILLSLMDFDNENE